MMLWMRDIGFFVVGVTRASSMKAREKKDMSVRRFDGGSWMRHCYLFSFFKEEKRVSTR